MWIVSSSTRNKDPHYKHRKSFTVSNALGCYHPNCFGYVITTFKGFKTINCRICCGFFVCWALCHELRIANFLSPKWQCSGEKSLLATLNNHSTAADDAGMPKTFLASFASVGYFHYFVWFCLQNEVWLLLIGKLGCIKYSCTSVLELVSVTWDSSAVDIKLNNSLGFFAAGGSVSSVQCASVCVLDFSLSTSFFNSCWSCIFSFSSLHYLSLKCESKTAAWIYVVLHS